MVAKEKKKLNAKMKKIKAREKLMKTKKKEEENTKAELEEKQRTEREQKKLREEKLKLEQEMKEMKAKLETMEWEKMRKVVVIDDTESDSQRTTGSEPPHKNRQAANAKQQVWRPKKRDEPEIVAELIRRNLKENDKLDDNTGHRIYGRNSKRR